MSHRQSDIHTSHLTGRARLILYLNHRSSQPNRDLRLVYHGAHARLLTLMSTTSFLFPQHKVAKKIRIFTSQRDSFISNAGITSELAKDRCTIVVTVSGKHCQLYPLPRHLTVSSWEQWPLVCTEAVYHQVWMINAYNLHLMESTVWSRKDKQVFSVPLEMRSLWLWIHKGCRF